MTSLDILGINEPEEKIYRILLVSGQLSTGEIRIASSLDQDTIQTSLQSLMGKKLIREVPGLLGRYTCLLPLGNLKEELTQSVAEVSALGGDLQNTSKTILETMETKFSGLTDKFIQDLDTQSKKFEDESGSFSTQTLSEQEASKENVKQLISEIESTEKTQIENTHTNLGTSIRDHTSKTVEALNSRLNNIDAKVEQIKQDQHNIKTASSSDLPTIDYTPVAEIEKDALVSVNSFVTQVNEAITTAQSKLDQTADTLDTISKTKNEEIQSAGTQFNEETNATLDGLSQHISNLITKEQEETNSLGQSIESAKSTGISSIQSSLSEQNTKHEEIVNSITEIQNQFKAYHAENSSELHSTTTQIGSKIQDLLTQSTNELAGQTDAVKTQLNTSMLEEAAKLQSQLEEHLNQVINQSKEQLQTFTQSFNEKLDLIVTDMHTQRNTSKASLESAITTSVTELQESFQGFVVKSEETETSYFNSLRGKMALIKQSNDSSLNAIIGDLENLSNTINSRIQSSLEGTNELGKTGNEQIAALQNSQETHFNASVMNALTEISQLLNQEISQLKEHHQVTSTELVELYAQINTTITTTINQKVEALRQSIHEIYELTVSNLKDALEGTHQKYMELVDASRATSVGSVKQAERDIEALTTELQTTVDANIETLNQQIQSLTATLQNESIQFLDKSYVQLQSQSNAIRDAGTQSVNEVKELASGGGVEQVSTVKDTFARYQSKYNETTKVVSEKTLALANMLDSLFSIQEATETPPVKTTAVVGKEAITSYLSDIIGRTKSKVTILVPSIDMIDTDQILGMKRTAQVTLISHIDEVVEKDWIDKMHNATANVTLRSITKSDFGGQLPDFIGVEREGEEILLGTIDEGAKDYVAISSASEYFTKILGGIVISDYARGKSAQLKK
ncbi:MAG: helix-turn-helix domain-containing protein [Candidatus Kariarchaeaceae archaeon]|jgi:sugar-specific transcriptional regulator TrmB